MKSTLTRREFLLWFVPPGLTWRRAKIVGWSVLALVIGVGLYRGRQEVDFLGWLKLAGWAALVLAAVLVVALALGLAARVLAFLLHRLPPAPAWLRAGLSVVWAWLRFAVAAAIGIALYRRWESGSDLSGTVFVIGVGLVTQIIAAIENAVPAGDAADPKDRQTPEK